MLFYQLQKGLRTYQFVTIILGVLLLVILIYGKDKPSPCNLNFTMLSSSPSQDWYFYFHSSNLVIEMTVLACLVGSDKVIRFACPLSLLAGESHIKFANSLLCITLQTCNDGSRSFTCRVSAFPEHFIIHLLNRHFCRPFEPFSRKEKKLLSFQKSYLYFSWNPSSLPFPFREPERLPWAGPFMVLSSSHGGCVHHRTYFLNGDRSSSFLICPFPVLVIFLLPALFFGKLSDLIAPGGSPLARHEQVHRSIAASVHWISPYFALTHQVRFAPKATIPVVTRRIRFFSLVSLPHRL